MRAGGGASTFGQLFRYARESAIEARENFTTEAFAAAASHDPEPLIRLLRDHKLLAEYGEPAEVSVQTQVHVRTAGIIDLVVETREASRTTETWIEVKVDASESGSQLTNYKAWIAKAALGRPNLATLSKERLAGHSDVTWISWRSVRRTIQAMERPGVYWQDLSKYLKEIGMADDSEEPIVAREAASLLDAHSLYRKTSNIVSLVVEEGRAKWGQLGWPKSSNDADEQLLWQFKAMGRITLPLKTSTTARVVFGVVQHDASAEFDKPEPHLTTWVEHAPKQSDLRRQLVDQADSAGLPGQWTRRLAGWWALTASERIGAFGDHTSAKDWVIRRFEDLELAGIISLLTETSTTSAIDSDDPPDAGAPA